jgi:hypothetical protein
MCTLGIPRLGLNSQPFTIGARPAGTDRTSATASFGRRWPRMAFLALFVVLRVAGATTAGWLGTHETVAVETPTRLATSWMLDKARHRPTAPLLSASGAHDLPGAVGTKKHACMPVRKSPCPRRAGVLLVFQRRQRIDARGSAGRHIGSGQCDQAHHDRDCRKR